LHFARIQHGYNIRGTYYFRLLPNHFDKEIIRQIASLGHEVGYHYDDLSHCKGNYEAAIKRFEKNLATLREIAPVKTICMEGAPLSKWDNRTLWVKHQIPNSKFQTNSKLKTQNSKLRTQNSKLKTQNSELKTQNSELKTQNSELKTQNSELKTHYSAYGITGEPYFDLDFSKVLYLTDTGRRWDGKGSIRDKIVQSSRFKVQSEVESVLVKSGNSELNFRRTADIIAAANNRLLPDQIMFTFHPQRWTDRPLPWVKELVLQNLKNVVKRWMVGRRA